MLYDCSQKDSSVKEKVNKSELPDLHYVRRNKLNIN